MVRLSKHATRRSQQRGIAHRLIEAVLEHADNEIPIGDDFTVLWVSKRLAQCIPGLDKLANVGLIWSGANAQIVSVIHIRDRHYRQGNRGR
jgi:hypothetical protein